MLIQRKNWYELFSLLNNFDDSGFVQLYYCKCIWRERIFRSFEGRERPVAELKKVFVKTSFEWISGLGCFFCENLIDFIDICSFQV